MKLPGVEQMNKNKRLKLIVMLLVTLFFGIVLGPVANATSEEPVTEKEESEQKSVDDLQWSEWQQSHTMEVEVTTVYDYKTDGTLKITETYSGIGLKSKFKENELTRSQTFPVSDGKEIAFSTKSDSLKLKPGDKKEFVTQKSVVITTSNDPFEWWNSSSLASISYPQWTFSKITSGQNTYYVVADPINLIWKQKSLKTVKNTILKKKWIDNPVEYTHYISYPNGNWVAGDGMADNKYRLLGGYHLRLWKLPNGNVVSNAHHDDSVLIIPGHQVDGYENAETKVAKFFGTGSKSYWLDNVYYSKYYKAYNDGSAKLF